MQNIQDIINTTQINQLNYKIAYLDYQESEEEIRIKRQIRRDKVVESIVDDVDNSKEISEIDTYIDTNSTMPSIGLKVFSKSGTLTNKITSNNIDDVYNKIYDDVLQKIKKLCDKNTFEIEKSGMINFGGSKVEVDVSQIDDQMKYRKILTKCISCSNMIATQGRRGPAQIAIMSYHLSSMIGEIPGLKTVVNNSCGNSIYMFRKSRKDESGLQLIHNQKDNKTIMYELIEIGNKPYNQFIRLDVIF